MKFQQQAFARNPRTPMLGELRFQDSRGGEKRDWYMNAIALIYYKKLETEPPSHRHMVLEQWYASTVMPVADGGPFDEVPWRGFLQTAEGYDNFGAIRLLVSLLGRCAKLAGQGAGVTGTGVGSRRGCTKGIRARASGPRHRVINRSGDRP